MPFHLPVKTPAAELCTVREKLCNKIRDALRLSMATGTPAEPQPLCNHRVNRLGSGSTALNPS